MIDLKKRPKKIVICGHEVKIFYKKKMKEYGLFYPDDNEIDILYDERWKEHLMHEICHAILFYSGYSELLGRDLEESIVRALENGFKSMIFI